MEELCHRKSNSSPFFALSSRSSSDTSWAELLARKIGLTGNSTGPVFIRRHASSRTFSGYGSGRAPNRMVHNQDRYGAHDGHQ
jgi:hypothetical protein